MKAPQTTPKVNSKKSFYKRWWFITLAMIFITPLGIFLWFKFTKKPHVSIKIIVSVIALIIWVSVLVQEATGYSQTFDINGKQVTIECERLCTYVGEYGDSDALKILAGMGIKRVEKMPSEAKNGEVKLSADSASEGGAINLTLNYNQGKLVSIINSDYPTIVYYSNDSTVATLTYPARKEIAEAKSRTEQEQKEVAAKKAQEDAQKAQEAAKVQAQKAAEEKALADKKAAEEAAAQAAAARVPSESGTVELCTKQFNSTYPYKGSKVHSILGVITNSQYSEDSRLYKVEVTIENAFGASRGGVMECVVQKTGDMIQVTTFNVY